MIMHPLPFVGVRGGGDAASSGRGEQGRGEERLRTFFFPQTMLLSPRQAPAGLLQRSEPVAVLHPSRTACSRCDRRQPDRDVGKAAERSLARCDQRGVRVGEGAAVTPAQRKKSPCAFSRAPCSASSAGGGGGAGRYR